MTIEKLLCPQCGSNELETFGASAYKCQSCGTILKEEQPKEPQKEIPKQKPFRSKRIQRGLEDEAEFAGDFSEDHHEAGGQFIKLIFWIGIVTGCAALCAWLLFK